MHAIHCVWYQREEEYTHTDSLTHSLSLSLSFHRPPLNLFYCALLILAEKLYSHLAFAVKINKTNSPTPTPTPSSSGSPSPSPFPSQSPSPSSTATSGESLCSFSTGVCWLFCLFLFWLCWGSRSRRRGEQEVEQEKRSWHLATCSANSSRFFNCLTVCLVILCLSLWWRRAKGSPDWARHDSRAAVEPVAI